MMHRIGQGCLLVQRTVNGVYYSDTLESTVTILMLVLGTSEIYETVFVNFDILDINFIIVLDS